MDSSNRNPLGGFLRCYRDEHGLSLRALAEKAGVSPAYVSNLERGSDPMTKKPVKPSAKKLSQLAKATMVEPAFLVALATGQDPGSPRQADPRTELLHLLENQARELERFKVRIQEPGMREIPHFGPVACGNTGYLPNEPLSVTAWPTFLVGSADFSVQVKGDSLDRQGLMEGDWVFLKTLSPDRRPREGSIVLASLREGEDYLATLKLFSKRGGRYRLEPDSTNEDHHPVAVDDDVRVLGQVVWHCSDPARFA
ncbi:helix-turn-helix domain-containing protein [bacterium]|nr:helix-turn-helix domain-containing protein [bacterium]